MNEDLSDAESLDPLGKFKEILSSWRQTEPGLLCVCLNFFLRETNLAESERVADIFKCSQALIKMLCN